MKLSKFERNQTKKENKAISELLYKSEKLQNKEEKLVDKEDFRSLVNGWAEAA